MPPRVEAIMARPDRAARGKGRHVNVAGSVAPPLSPRAAIAALEARLIARLVGGKGLARRLVLALLADGHVLLEGVPGVAKTRATTALGEALEATFRRVALGPDQGPANLFGTGLADAALPSHRGRHPVPALANVFLAEGIDRASPEARLALLDAMTERQVAVGGVPVRLPEVFLVCATRTLVQAGDGGAPMGPDERDRFLLHVRLGYPDEADERRMLGLVRAERASSSAGSPRTEARLPLAVVLAARCRVQTVKAGPRILKRITALVASTRHGDPARNAAVRWIRGGAGPRGSIALERCAQAHAWLAGRRQVTERDLAAVAHDVLRHRIDLSEAAEEAGVTTDVVIDDLLTSSRP
jgi:MoxR-like ATPase